MFSARAMLIVVPVLLFVHPTFTVLLMGLSDDYAWAIQLVLSVITMALEHIDAYVYMKYMKRTQIKLSLGSSSLYFQ